MLHGTSDPAPPDVYPELTRLPFVEEYPGRGYNLHSLTRQTVLRHLWRDERDFYYAVSEAAVQFFGDRLAADDDDSDPTLLVEFVYHLLIANGDSALGLLDDAVDELARRAALGDLNALVQAAAEHAEDGRLSTEAAAHVSLGRAVAVSVSGDYRTPKTLRCGGRAPGGRRLGETRAEALIRLARLELATGNAPAATTRTGAHSRSLTTTAIQRSSRSPTPAWRRSGTLRGSTARRRIY